MSHGGLHIPGGGEKGAVTFYLSGLAENLCVLSGKSAREEVQALGRNQA